MSQKKSWTVRYLTRDGKVVTIHSQSENPQAREE